MKNHTHYLNSGEFFLLTFLDLCVHITHSLEEQYQPQNGNSKGDKYWPVYDDNCPEGKVDKGYIRGKKLAV